ncbi:MAG: hypothetical protein C0503_09440 [Gemmatimonas sp.]|nr:hypothetical protein [Gemmatimonas sp.]
MADRSSRDVFDPARLVRVLAEHDVRYVLIGAVAARLAGYPLATYDTDLTPERSPENLTRLAAALRALDARVYTVSVPEGLPFDCSPQALARAEVWNLVTTVGRVDVLFSPAGSGGYADLAQSAETFDVNDVPVSAASLPSLIKMKEAAGRPKDLQAVAIIKAMLERDERRR